MSTMFECKTCFTTLTREEMGNHVCPDVRYEVFYNRGNTIDIIESTGRRALPTKREALQSFINMYTNGLSEIERERERNARDKERYELYTQKARETMEAL
jgi:hypothetical protein